MIGKVKVISIDRYKVDCPVFRGQSRAREIWKLTHRYHRLCRKADRVRGTCINMAWYAVAGAIDECLDMLEALGVDVETLGDGTDWTQAVDESKSSVSGIAAA